MSAQPIKPPPRELSMMPTEIIEEAFPTPWHAGARGFGDGVHGWALLYWAMHHFDINDVEDFERRVSGMDSDRAKVTVDDTDYVIPDCCYMDYWFGDSSPWSLPKRSDA